MTALLRRTGITGKRIVITRAADQSDTFAAKLQTLGAVPLAYPCIAIMPVMPPEGVLTAAYDWLILTSVNTARFLADVPLTVGAVAAVGTQTAAACEQYLGRKVDAIPSAFYASYLPDALPDLTGKRVLLPQSELADEALAENLRARGAVVTVVTLYRNVIGSGGVDLPALLAAGTVDCVTFTSASTVNNCLVRLGDAATLLQKTPIACIGDQTAKAAKAAGLAVAVIPPQPTIAALLATLALYFTE